MTFYIYNNRGFRVPFHPGDKWRETEEVPGIGAFNEKSKDKQDQEDRHQDKHETYEDQDIFPSKISKSFKDRTIVVASQIMSKPVTTLYPEDSLKEAWKLFDQKRFRHVPIISREHKILGLLSDRTLLHETVEFVKHVPEGEDDRCVKEVMITNILCAQPNTDISHIAKIFIDEKVGAMPIVNAQGMIEGILTRSDILRTIVKVHSLELQI